MMNIDYSESDEDGDSKDLMEHSGQDAAAGTLQPMDDDEVTAELRRREAEDEEIQRHLHQDEEEDANLNAMLNDNAAEVGAGGDAGAPIQNGTANDNDDEDRERDFLNGNDNGDAQNGDDGDYDEMESEEDEEDDIQITIGDFSKPSLTGAGASAINSLSMNKGGRQFIIGASNAAGGSKSKSSLDLDAVGQYKDVPIFDLNFDTLEDKPWRKPGADITDYFNYGFNEDSWKVYCDRQKKIRSLNASNVFDVNSVINLSSMPVKTLVDGQMVMTAPLHPMDKPMPLSSVNENSKYHSSGSIVISTMMGKRSGPPPGRKTSGAIDVIGGTGTTTMLMNNMNAPMLTPRDETPPPMHTREGLIPTPNMTKENNNQSNFISVIGQRGGPPGPPGLYPPPPLNMPPPFFAPDGFPPMRPPPGMSILGPPPMGPNGQPVMGYGRPGDFPPMNQPRFPPHGGILPHPDLSQQIPFEEDYLHDSVPSRPRAPSSRMSPSRDRHHERERHSRDRESSYSSSRRGGGGGSSYRDHDDSGRSETRGEGSRTGGSSRRDHYREREYRDGGDRGDRGGERRERSRERSQEQPRGGGRSSREKDYESPSVRPTEQPSQHQQSSSTISPIVSSAPAPTTSSSKEPAPKDSRDTQSTRSRHRDRSDRKSREKEESSSRSERKDNTKDKDTTRSEKESRSDRGDRGDRDKEKDKSDSHHHRSSKDSKAEAKESKSSSSKKGGHDDHSDRKHNTSSSSSSRHHDKSSSSKGGGGGSSSKSKPSKSSSSRRSKDKDRSRKDSD